MPAFLQPLEADVIDGDVFIRDPAGGSDLWMSPEAVLASLAPLKRAAEEALRSRTEREQGPGGQLP